MGRKVVVLSPTAEYMEHFRSFAVDDVDLDWVDSEQSVEELAAQLADAQAVIPMKMTFPVELARVCPNLRLIQTTSAGTDRLDKQALGELGVRVANNGGGNAVAVAEHTITLMVSAYRKLHLQIAYAREGQWMGDLADHFSEAHEIAGKTVGIIGLGRIGSRVARRLAGWDCELVYYDVIAIPAAVEEELHITRLARGELLRTADVVTLHVPLNSQTRGFISDAELASMKPTAVLVNCSRGPVVDEAALVRSLKAGEIAGAALDVLEEEPTPADNPLLAMDNVVVTPHLASYSQESLDKARAFAVYNASRVARGQEPESIVLPD